MDPCEDDNFLTDRHGQEAHTFPPNKPKCRRNLLIGVVIAVLSIAAVAAVAAVARVIGAALGHFSSSTGNTDRITICLFYDKIDDDIDPFIDKCTPGSQYVKDRCNNRSSHSCNDCCDDCKINLPKECFCDIYRHCPENRDRPAKRKYNECLDEYCPCLNNGTCKDLPFQTATAKDIECFCQEGFSGRYCQYKPIRICTNESSTSLLKSCSKNNDAECYFSRNNTRFICKIPQRQFQTPDGPNCTID